MKKTRFEDATLRDLVEAITEETIFLLGDNEAAYALSLAHQYGAELIVLHVVSFSLYEFAASWETEVIYGQPSIRLILNEALREARRDLSRFVQGDFSDGIGDLKCTLRVGSGDVSDEIVSAACQADVDLIEYPTARQRS
jgi:nucleotide-binding universal stress UspA family protein